MDESKGKPLVKNGRLAGTSALELLWVWTCLGIVCFTRFFYYGYLPVGGGCDKQGYRPGRDFVNVWMGGKLTLEGKAADLFSGEKYLADLRQMFGDHFPWQNFAYPPNILPLILVFGFFGYFTALALWVALGSGVLGAVLKKIRCHAFSWQQVLLVLTSPAAVINLLSGQNGAFTAAFFLGGLYLSESAPVAAGVLLGLLTVKPHLGILVPPVLLLCRRWKCFGVAAATSLALAGLSYIAWGGAVWKAFFHDTLPFQAALLLKSGNYYNLMMPGVYNDLCLGLKLDPVLTTILYCAISAYALALAFIAVRKEGISPRSVLMLGIATIAVLPYGFNYDMVAIMGAMVVYLATVAEVELTSYVLMGLLWAMPLFMTEAKMMGFPMLCLLLLAVLQCLHMAAGEKKTTI